MTVFDDGPELRKLRRWYGALKSEPSSEDKQESEGEPVEDP